MATIEELVACDASKLEAMTDQELLKHFEQYLNITRQELAPKQQRQEQRMLAENPKLKQGLNLLKDLGIDIGSSLQPYRKKK